MYTYLKNYTHFSTKEELDAATNLHIAKNYNHLNSTDRTVLDTIRRYSVKYGSAHLKAETIGKAIKKSESTVRRAIRKLEKLSIIERIPYVRPVLSGLGANVYSILPINEQAEMNTPSKAEEANDGKNQANNSADEPLFIKSNNKDLKETYPAEKMPLTLFERMKSILSSTIGDVALARKLFGIHRYHSLKLLMFSIYSDKEELFDELALRALHITVQKTKQKTIHNMAGYYSGVLNKLIDETLFSDTFHFYDKPADQFFYK
ncbi:helix-turn-helix domain-containing protein [Psychrobacillus soli]|uniref:Helix-turn-helix domain-containing protein n=1 Tax=Psychrobacillus soli TaxID=1543965 RepID=A0A544TM21_9BACI|nr:helix-turn-helix domain-containing protein [Psychrobacillus soli]TQR18479.1 helix-turn-helix domain-containing protein [Psychrobacillus soli]